MVPEADEESDEVPEAFALKEDPELCNVLEHSRLRAFSVKEAKDTIEDLPPTRIG